MIPTPTARPRKGIRDDAGFSWILVGEGPYNRILNDLPLSPVFRGLFDEAIRKGYQEIVLLLVRNADVLTAAKPRLVVMGRLGIGLFTCSLYFPICVISLEWHNFK